MAPLKAHGPDGLHAKAWSTARRSPLTIFIFLTMERLGHAIRNVVDVGSWIPLLMARSGLPLSHLLFADDLILYAKADLTRDQNVSSILSEFGKHSGH
ncbi:hypothetical protein HRI_001462000 [Hibiscus trionum]|uniref:Reverse transcriptase domain-containing protein n=1 Tax=Hibiscus trionum TaxID=183268 RepID=A0A9W7LUE0_HIBTR|nr:hypothetical protein HRI_001462000 [Hibiscus trionum]